MEIVHCVRGARPTEACRALSRRLARALDARLTLAAKSQPLLKALSQQLEIPEGYLLKDLSPDRTGDVLVAPDAKMAARLLKATLHPVMVARSDSELRRVLLCSGGSHQFDRALEFAIQLASALGSRMTLFHVMASPPPLYADYEDLPPNEQASLNRVLREQEAMLKVADVEFDVAAAWGDVAREIRRKVRNGQYDLAVVGSSARSLMLGDMTSETMATLPCPVLVVPTHQELGLVARLGRWLKALAS